MKKENILLRKSLEEKERFIRYLVEKLQGKAFEEAYEQEKIYKEIAKSREFKILFNPEKPIKIISAYTYEPFRDASGKEYPYLAGIKICHDAEQAFPYMVFLLKRKPKDKTLMSLKTVPKIWFPFSLLNVFKEQREFFFSLKHGGVVEVLITPDGLFTGDRIKVEARKEESENVSQRPKKRRK